LNVRAGNAASLARVQDKRQEVPAHEWPLVSLGNISRVEDSVESLAVDYYFFQSPNDSFSTEDVYDGENINSENVSKRVASKLKSIAPCIEVAFLGYEMGLSNYYQELKRAFFQPS